MPSFEMPLILRVQADSHEAAKAIADDFVVAAYEALDEGETLVTTGFVWQVGHRAIVLDQPNS